MMYNTIVMQLPIKATNKEKSTQKSQGVRALSVHQLLLGRPLSNKHAMKGYIQND